MIKGFGFDDGSCNGSCNRTSHKSFLIRIIKNDDVRFIMQVLSGFIISGIICFFVIISVKQCHTDEASIKELLIKKGREQFAMEAVKSGHGYWGSDTNGNPVFMWKDIH